MKKYVFSLLAVIVVVVGTSFTPQKIKMNDSISNPPPTYKWFDFNGGEDEMCDPDSYSLDPNNFPDCPPSSGTVYCEIHALPSEYDPGKPDLAEIVGFTHRY